MYKNRLFCLIYAVLILIVLTNSIYAQQVDFISENDQYFIKNDLAAEFSPVTIISDTGAAAFHAGDNLRIIIPDTLFCIWDASVSTITVSDLASDRVSQTVSYVGNKEVIIHVTSAFVADTNSIVVGGLKFKDFTQSSSGQLRLFFSGGSKADVNSVYIGEPTISSEKSSVSLKSSGTVTLPDITFKNDSLYKVIKPNINNSFSIILPPELNAGFNTSITNITGSAKIAFDRYSTNGDSLIITVQQEFDANETVVISGLELVNINISQGSKLRLSFNGITVTDEDDKTIKVGNPTFNSLNSQFFVYGDESTPIATMTIQEDPQVPIISNARSFLRIIIPNSLSVSWDNGIPGTSFVISPQGTINKSEISYQDSALILPFDAAYTSFQTLTISGPQFKDFDERTSGSLYMDFSVETGDIYQKTDSTRKLVVRPTFFSAENQYFAVNDPETLSVYIVIKGDTEKSGIRKEKGVRIILPPELNLEWADAGTAVSNSATALSGYPKIIGDTLPPC